VCQARTDVLFVSTRRSLEDTAVFFVRIQSTARHKLS
jgi:hypothetical protein